MTTTHKNTRRQGDDAADFLPVDWPRLRRAPRPLFQATLLSLFFASPAWPGDFTVNSAPPFYEASPETRDEIDMTKEGESLYHLTYHNNLAMHSSGGDYSLSHGKVHISLHVEVGDAETVTVSPSEPWVSIPEQLQIKDGETGTFQISLPMY